MENSDKSIDELKKSILNWMSWFPTFDNVPTDLRENSIPVNLENQDVYWIALAQDAAMTKWVKAVEPVETIEIWGDDMGSALQQGVDKLQNLNCNPTVLYGNPRWMEDILNIGHGIIKTRDITDRRAGHDLTIGNVTFFGDIFLDYSEGLYLFNNEKAQLYIAGATCNVWNVRPLTVQLIKKGGKQ